MISSVSNINFRGDAAPVNHQDLINSPGKFTTTQPPKADAPADSFEKKDGAEGAEKKKSKAPVIIGSIAGLLALAYIGLGIAVGKGKLTKAVAEEGKELGFMGKVKNFFVSIGENAENLWNRIRGKKAEEGEVNPKKEKADSADEPKSDTDVKTETEGNRKPEADGKNETEAEAKQEGENK